MNTQTLKILTSSVHWKNTSEFPNGLMDQYDLCFLQQVPYSIAYSQLTDHHQWIDNGDNIGLCIISKNTTMVDKQHHYHCEVYKFDCSTDDNTKHWHAYNIDGLKLVNCLPFDMIDESAERMQKSISELLRVCGTSTDIVLIGDFRNGISDRSHGRSLSYRGFTNHIVDSDYTKVITRTDSTIKISNVIQDEGIITFNLTRNYGKKQDSS